MTLDTCPICGFRPSTITPNGDRATIHCERCGDFDLTGTTFDIAQHWGAGQQPARDPRGRFSASHAIRRMQVRGRPRPQINSKLLGAIWSQPLPPMQRQAEPLILALGDQDLSPGEYVRWRIERFCAEVGTRDDPPTGLTSALNAVMRHLEGRFIEIERQPPSPNIGLRLTFDGWGEYERLRRETAESKTAFMAMGYGNADVAHVVADVFVLAVRETGFDLYRLDDRPKAGLIDNRMRVDIRTAKFLVCDLTDENRGAYWEAGFAEGTGKPVFYTCEGKKFDSVRPH